MGKSAITKLTKDLVVHLNLNLGISNQLGFVVIMVILWI